ncbi:hypothetical protein PHET_11689 [Paragonimus heterotremus]|uniref:Uncharacterized protein n=1 Tax=Paragonimus heterotremus TaxID=100268 RepID=A0A8J4SKX3_9TREM|nr:hypothetical protein PHET_11689 [Paragonimus heterotremus]
MCQRALSHLGDCSLWNSHPGWLCVLRPRLPIHMGRINRVQLPSNSSR